MATRGTREPATAGTERLWQALEDLLKGAAGAVAGHLQSLSGSRITLNPVRRCPGGAAAPKRHVERYVTEGQAVADLGCATGYYTLALAECVGPDGRVYAVDLDGERIARLQQRVRERGYCNVETHAASAAELDYIPDASVDFVLANGLLCNMPNDRPLAVREINRILKPGGMAYLSLGMPRPIGYVSRAEWEEILAGFVVERRGGGLQKWAHVYKKG